MPPETRAQKKRQAHTDPQVEEQSAKRQRRHSSKHPSNKPSSKDEEQAPAQQAPGPNAALAKGRRSARSQGGRSGRRGAAPSQAEAEAGAQQPAGPSNPPAPIPAAPAPQQAPQENTGNQPAAGEDEAMAGRGRDDDGEGDDMARNLSSASNALQGLLRKLGAGFDDAFMAMGGISGGRFKNIIADLRQAEDEGAQLTALTELCELLAISSEENLTTFPVETAVPLLVQSLNTEHNPDIMLVAARALTFLADMMPSACSSIVRHGAVTSFCQRLLTIEYIDLAEQSLLALEKLSHEHAHALLQQGGLLAVLSYLDFFPTGVQRVAVGTAANMCRGLTSEDASAVQEAIPILTNLLQYQDVKVVDSACQALSNVADSYANKPNLLAMLSTGGLITQALQMIALTENGSCSAQLSLTTYYSMIKLLTTCCSKSPSVAQQLLEGQILPILHTLLATSSLLPSRAARSNGHAMLRSPDQLHEVISLLCELQPPVGSPATLVMEDQPAIPASNGGPSASSSAAVPKRDERAQYYEAFPDATRQAVQQLVPLMLQLHSATVMPHVRQQCLTALLRLLALASPSMLQDGLRNTPVFSFLSSLLSSRDQPTQAAGLLMCEILMAKLPQVYKQSFLKEGVLQALHHMSAKSAAPAVVKAQPAAASATPAGQQAAQAAAAEDKTDKSEEKRRVTRLSSKKNSPSNSSKELAAAGAAARSTSPSSSKPPAPQSGPSLPRPARGSTPARADAAEPTDKAEPAAAATPVAPPTLGSKLAARAAAFCEQHFADCVPGSQAMETNGMKRLRAAAEQICKDPQAVQQLLQLLSSGAAPAPASGEDKAELESGVADMVLDSAADLGDSISVYELLNSGAVQALTDYLQGADLTGQGAQVELLARLRSFVQTALAADSGDQPMLVPVMRKLQAALAAAETFPVLLSRVQPAGGARMPGAGAALGRLGGGWGGGSAALSSSAGSYRSGLAALSRPFKLRLCRHSTEKGLRDYGSNVVLIEPLASMSTIEDFLYPRVCQSSSSPPTRSRDGSGQAAAAATTTAAAAAGTSSGATAGKSPGSGKEKDRSGSLGALLDSARQAATVAAASAAKAAANKASNAAPASSAQPIPDDKGGRRSTRAAARARANASAEAAAAPAGVVEDEDGDVLMGPAADEVEEDVEMEEAYGEEGAAVEGMPPGATFYDDDDEDYDEELEGDDDDADMDIGNMQVHDLHVEDQPAATATDAAAGLPRARSSPAPRPAAGAAAVPAPAATAAGEQSRLATTASEPPPAWGAARSGTAAAAGGASGSAWERRDAGNGSAAVSEQPRLVFYSGSQKLATSTTVFQAIQHLSISQLAGSNQEGGAGPSSSTAAAGSERQMWDGIYTLYYRAADANDAAPSGAATVTEGASSASLLAGPHATANSAGLPLGAAAHLQMIQAISLPEDMTAEPACLQVLNLIKVLEAVNRFGARVCYAAEAEDDALQGNTSATTAGLPQQKRSACSGEPAAACDRPVYGRVPRSELVCSKLNSKLAQQLKDVLAICGGGMPAWCKQLVFSCKHLFTLNIRRHYFYCTALGLGRALQHMQALHANEAGEAGVNSGGPAERDARDMRLGRLQRQKVRVSRKRILESAIKVMELYASQRAVLELEYFGEVGTGLGPTLEFYTLLSHDLQRRNLKMWRHEDAATPGTPLDGEGQQGGATDGVKQQAATETNGLGPIASVARQALLQGNRPALSAQTHVEAWHDDTQFVNAPWGLFPSPIPPSQRSSGKVLDLFKLLGRAMAKALQDNRLMDLPLSYTFYRAVQGVPLDMYDIASFDPGLGQQLQRLWSSLLVAQGRPNQAAPAATAPQPASKQGGGRKRGSGSSKKAAAPSNNAAGSAAKPVMVDGVPVEDLCLTFTLPGYPEYELVPGGADVVVDSSNLRTWIQAVVDATLGDGIAAQLTAFKAGFNEVFPLSHLAAFYEDEIESLLCGTGERWDVASLSAAIKFDHGYTSGSPVVIALLEVLSELDSQDQRRFLRFVTGCPRLPSGGLSALQPRLTVVRKHPSSERSASLGSTPVGSLRAPGDVLSGGGTILADGDLPSVMTCANYIKLPPYSSKQVLRERLLYAIREGQGSFDLS